MASTALYLTKQELKCIIMYTNKLCVYEITNTDIAAINDDENYHEIQCKYGCLNHNKLMLLLILLLINKNLYSVVFRKLNQKKKCIEGHLIFTHKSFLFLRNKLWTSVNKSV